MFQEETYAAYTECSRRKFTQYIQDVPGGNVRSIHRMFQEEMCAAYTGCSRRKCTQYIQSVRGGNVRSIYRMFQEEMPIFWEVIFTVHSKAKKKIICTGFLLRTVSDIEVFHCTVAKLLIRERERDYVLFLISVFIVQVTKLVQFA